MSLKWNGPAVLLCSAVTLAMPVTFPPGRGRLMTRPVPIGSPVSAITIGISRVACFAATAVGVNQVTMTSTLRRTSSAASSGSRSICPSADRNSNRMFCPSIYPRSRSPCRNSRQNSSGLILPITSAPMVGTFGCCARRKRPRRRASEQRDEFAPFHCLPMHAGSRQVWPFNSGHQNRKLRPANGVPGSSFAAKVLSRLCLSWVKSTHYRNATANGRFTSQSGLAKRVYEDATTTWLGRSGVAHERQIRSGDGTQLSCSFGVGRTQGSVRNRDRLGCRSGPLLSHPLDRMKLRHRPLRGTNLLRRSRTQAA